VYCVFRDDPRPLMGKEGVGGPNLDDLATGQEVCCAMGFFHGELLKRN